MYLEHHFYFVYLCMFTFVFVYVLPSFLAKFEVKLLEKKTCLLTAFIVLFFFAFQCHIRTNKIYVHTYAVYFQHLQTLSKKQVENSGCYSIKVVGILLVQLILHI